MSLNNGNGSFRKTVSKYIKDTTLSLIERAYYAVSGKKIEEPSPTAQHFQLKPEEFCYINGEYTLLSDALHKYENGYFTGAFDIVHDAHVKQIQRAAAICKKLFVGVSTDEVIEGYKHAKPVMPYDTRSCIIQGIKGVYKAVPQTDLHDKMGPCEEYGIDVILTSDEYLRSTYGERPMTEKERLGVERWEKFQQEANEKGIDIIYLPREHSLCKSSSDIKKTILAKQPVEKENVEVVADTNAETPLEAEVDLVNWERFATYSGAPVYSEGECCLDDSFCQ